MGQNGGMERNKVPNLSELLAHTSDSLLWVGQHSSQLFHTVWIVFLMEAESIISPNVSPDFLHIFHAIVTAL